MPTQYIIFAVLALALIGLFVWLFLISKRLKIFFKGKQAADLEDYINTLNEKIKKLEMEKEDLQQRTEKLQNKMVSAIRGVGTIRFNPFKDAGGNQSFAIAFLDEAGNGVVISSLYAREKMSVFAKPINKFKSEFELTAEEKEAIKKAIIK